MAEGTRLGTGYVEVEPDFSRFQEVLGRRLNEALTPQFRKAGSRAGKELARGVDRGGLGRSLAPLLRRFEKFGDDAGKAIAQRVGRGATKAKTDMFGLADAMSEVERRSRKAGAASKRLERDMFGVNQAAKESGRSLVAAKTQLRDWSTESRAADGGARRLTQRVRALGAGLRDVTRNARSAVGGFGGFDGTMARVNRSFQFFRNILRTLKWPVLIAGIGLTLQGLSALAAGAVATASSLGTLAGALVLLPAAALTAAQAFGALKLATAGIGGAVKAALDAEIQGGTQAVDTMRQQEAAAERVADAKRSLTDVQRQAKVAQEDLTQAREDARRELEDMRIASERSRDSEQEGALQLQQAQKDLRLLLRDPKAASLDIRFAEEAVDQARHDLEQTRLDAKRARQDYRDAQKVGVKGMPQVVAAKRAEEDASRAVEAAERDLKRAIDDNTVAMQEQGAAASALQEKMAQLPPAAQAFVRQLVALKPRLDELRDTAASGFLPGVSRGLRSLLNNFGPVRGIVGETASAFGRLAEQAGERLGSKEWGRDLGKIARVNTRAIDRMGNAGLNLADAFRHILVAARPFLDWMSEGTLRMSEWVEGEAAAGRESGRLADFFDRTRETMELLGPILKGVGGALLNIGEAARPLGNSILGALGDAAEGWREWTGSVRGQNDLRQYFAESKPAIFEMGRLIRDIGKAFFELGRQRGVAHLLRLVRTELIPAFRDLVGATTGWASSFLRDFGRLRKQGVPAFEAFIQVLFEHAAEAGWKIARALGNAFLNASIWGKLAIAGWLLHKFGGLGAFAKMGGRAGGRLGRSLFESASKWIAGTQAGGSLLGWFQDTFSRSGRFGKAAGTAGTRMGRIFGRGLAIGAVLGLAALAPMIVDFLRRHVKDPVQNTLKDIFGEGIGGALADAQDFAGKNFPASVPGGSLIREIFGGKDPLEIPVPKTEKAEGRLRRFSQSVGREANRARANFRKGIDPLPDIAGRSGAGINSQMLPRLDHLANQGGKKGDRFAGRLAGSFGSLSGAIRNALANIGDNVREALGKLNAGKPPRFNLKKLVQSLPHVSELPSIAPGKQRGGAVLPALATGGLASVVPGTSTGDRHVLSLNGRPVAKVESKEGIFVGNRNLMARLQEANAAVPRFQAGGIVSLGRQLQREGYEVGEHPAFGGVGTHTAGSYHYSGQALDINDDAPPFAPGGGEPGSLDRLAARLRKMPGVVELLWRVSDHFDHLHVALGKGASGFLGGLFSLPKPKVSGPAGPLRGLGQAAIDRVHKAARAFVEAEKPQTGKESSGGLTGSGNVEQVFAEVARRLSRSKTATLALGEAGFAESGMQDLGYGHSTSEGALQLLASTAAGMGIDPHDEAAVASAFLQRGFYGRGGANALAAQGLPAHLVAQSVQGSAFSDGSNYLAQEGTAKGWMRRFGLKLGGMVQLMSGGLIPGLQGGGQPGRGGKGKRKYVPMQRHLERLKDLGLRGADIGALTGSRISHLTGISTNVERFSEWASNASALTIETDNGTTIQGVFQGGTEGDWLLKQLGALGSLRNELLAAQEALAKARERAQKLIEQAERQVEAIKRQIQRAQQKRGHLVRNMAAAQKALGEARDDKDPKRRERRESKAQESIGALRERIAQLDFRQKQRGALVSNLEETTIPGLRERLTNVTAALAGTSEGGEGFIGLNQVQGLGGPTNPFSSYSADSPAIGTLGGEILSVQQRLRAIGEEGVAKAPEGKTEREELLEGILRQSNEREALRLDNLKTIREFPFLPPFGGIAHTGAIVPGPAGAERTMIVKAGEGIFTEEQMAAMGEAGGAAGPGGDPNIGITFYEGERRAEVEMGGRTFQAAVEEIVRTMPQSGRKTPGGTRF